MIIGVNARLLEKKKTGIGRIIESVFGEIKKQDQSQFDYLFFQKEKSAFLGKSVIKKSLPGLVGDFLFDTILVNWLAWRYKVDLVFGPAHILPFFRLPGMKYVVTIHDLSFLVFPKHNRRLFNLYYRLAIGWSIRVAHLVVADSESTKKDLIRFYRLPSDKIRVVYPGLSTQFQPPTFQKKEKYLFSLSTHPKRKNIECLIDLIAQSPVLADYQLYLAGLIPSDQKESLLSRAFKMGVAKRVKILGFVSEKKLVDLYRKTDLFIFPSFYEGFGFPVLEAMGCGSLVVAGKNSSLVELFPDKRFLVDRLELARLIEKVEWALKLSSSQKKQITKKQRQFVAEFSWKRTAQEYQDIFKKVASNDF